MSDLPVQVGSNLERGELCAPRASGDGWLSWDIKKVVDAETRAAEVATITPVKAPELLACFNDAHADACTIRAALEMELDTADSVLERTRARLLLDEVPKIIKERGLTNAKDTRDALIVSDPSYQEAEERRNLIKAILSLVKVKADKIHRAHTSVRQLVGERAFNWSAAGTSTRPDGSATPGFGNPRYER